MNAFHFSWFGALALCTAGALAQDAVRPPVYPYDVKVGGELAKTEGETPLFARASKAVKNDALIELGAGPGMVIANVFRCDQSGQIAPADEAQPGVIVVNQTTEFRLNQMKNKAALTPGFYLMKVVVFGNGTSQVLFEIGDGEDPDGPPAAAGAAIDQANPIRVLQAVFDSAKSGELAALKVLRSSAADGDVKNVCSVADAPPEVQADFRRQFEKGKIIGEARFEGNQIEIDFLFGPDGSSEETMQLVREGGKWFLLSF